MTSTVGADGVERTTVYGPYGQVAEKREAGDLVERTEFGALDLPYRVFRGDGTQIREVTYDAYGRPRVLENGTGEQVSLVYQGGFLESVTLPPYQGQEDRLYLEYNARGKLLSVTKDYPGGPGTTRYTYDGDGNRTSIVDPRGRTMSFTHDGLGRMLSYTDKLGKTVLYTYDGSGRERTRTNRNGEVLTRTYDAAGRLATLVGPGVDRELRYDALGRPVWQREGAHTVETTYDVNGVTSEHVSATGALGHADATWAVAFDAAGRLEELNGPMVSGDPGLAVLHGYDARGRLASGRR